MKTDRQPLAEMDVMSGTEFEDLVAALRRRTRTRRFGGGADLTARMCEDACRIGER
ncbi:hypothetical protein [Streptomyces lydicus]|uniref:hypothetical protein n=1 Tax=Streptomyces lydicus TaxID=47763 RepID=UPI0037B9DF1D